VRRALVRLGLLLQGAGAALLGAAGAICLIGGDTIGGGWTSAIAVSVGVDPLSGAFLAVLGLVAVPAALFAAAAVGTARAPRGLTALGGGFQLAMAGVLVARDPVTFLVCWELMSLLPAAAILLSHPDLAGRRTVFQYLAVTHVGGAGVWVAVLVLAGDGAFGDPAALSALGGGATALVAAAALIGFATKAGLAPLHVWLPRAHPMAPSHLSALMSGVMTKVSIYGIVRVLVQWLPDVPAWCGGALLAMGGVSALGGVVYALTQRDLKRLLAFSTVENVGIIALGLGAALLLADRGATEWAALAVAAALLHAANHAAFKGLLFMAAGAFERAGAGRTVDRMGGLLRTMPVTGGAALVGLVAFAGLPPIGFAAEWMTLRALAELPLTGAGGWGLAGAVALAALAAAAAVGAMVATVVAGAALLGRPRGAAAAVTGDSTPGVRVAVLFLAGVVVALGALPGLVVPSLAALAPGGGGLAAAPGLDLPGAGPVRTLALTAALVVLPLALLALRGRRTAAPAPTWACGQRTGPELDWTAAGFTKTLRLTLAGALRPERRLEIRASGGTTHEVVHRSRVPELLEERLLAPAIARVLRSARAARRLQSGSLRAYVAYLAGVVVVLLLLVRIGVLT
jgi:formate hydrogenlyase subunit 3/multisubunit Na+/H+ antiporter MnhD subunit